MRNREQFAREAGRRNHAAAESGRAQHERHPSALAASYRIGRVYSVRQFFVLAVALAALALAASPAGAEGFNGKIAAEADHRILVVNPDGTGLRYLTSDAYWSQNPAWAPGGRRLAFFSIRDGNHDIYTMEADGTGETRLTFYDSYDRDPTFSPDGSKILFTRLVSPDNQLWVMNADGSGQKQVGELVGHYPAWSPDGSKIAYTGFVGTPASQAEIFVANADGTGATPLTNSPEFDSYPRWTPDGDAIVFRQSGVSPVALVVPAAGGAAEPFTWAGNPFSALPTFSPNGEAVAAPGSVVYANGESIPLLGSVCCVQALAWQPLWVNLDPGPRRVITYGESVAVTVRLYWGDTSQNDSVSIYERRAGGDTLVGTATVDADGNAQITVTPAANTTYVAKWEGDSAHVGSTSDTALVEVHVVVRTRLAGAYGTSGRYRLYHAGRGVRQTATVLPSHAGKFVYFQAQRQNASGRWAPVAAIRLRLRSDSSVIAIFRTDRRGRYRTYNSFASDQDHLGGRSPFEYFKVTR